MLRLFGLRLWRYQRAKLLFGGLKNMLAATMLHNHSFKIQSFNQK